MNQLIESINNKDIALIISILVVLGFVVSKKHLRDSVLNILTSLIGYQILIPLILLLAYTYLLILILDNLGFWNISLVKDLIFWLVGTAFVLFINLPKAMKDESHFSKIINDSLKLAIIPQFIINLCDFHLIIELILLFALLLIGAIIAIADSPRHNEKKNVKQVKNGMNSILIFIGLAIFLFTIISIFSDFQKFATLNNLYSFLFPFILTFSVLPYLYFMALYMMYENIVIRLGHWLGKEKQLAKYLKFKMYISCHLNLKKLRAFSIYMNSMSMKSKDEILKEMQDFETYYSRRGHLA